MGTRPEQAHGRDVGGRLEAEALEQDGVGNEAQEAGQVDRAARGPIGGASVTIPVGAVDSAVSSASSCASPPNASSAK
jgi:hypothetical protein